MIRMAIKEMRPQFFRINSPIDETSVATEANKNSNKNERICSNMKSDSAGKFFTSRVISLVIWSMGKNVLTTMF